VAAWYDKLVGEAGSDYHQHVILPAALRLLNPKPGESIVDVCCGQGILAKHLLETKIARYVGVDASPRLIESAKDRYHADARASFIVADVCKPSSWSDQSHDAAACLMAVHDVPNAAAMFSSIRKALKTNGRALFIFMHPCFRIPKHTHWGWDNDQKVQFRRIDRYQSPVEIPIATHPGKNQTTETSFYHRPLAEILTALGSAGLAVTASEELCSHRRSQGNGPFSKAEHRAAEEFPLFLALQAVAI
jgi:ubiquinone/menaquinone biosynthesis C-methylase UbiE